MQGTTLRAQGCARSIGWRRTVLGLVLGALLALVPAQAAVAADFECEVVGDEVRVTGTRITQLYVTASAVKVRGNNEPFAEVTCERGGRTAITATGPADRGIYVFLDDDAPMRLEVRTFDELRLFDRSPGPVDHVWGTGPSGEMRFADGDGRTITSESVQFLRDDPLEGPATISLRGDARTGGPSTLSAFVLGGGGDDRLDGGDGNDLIFGGGGRDVIRGFAGDDQLASGGPSDRGGDQLDGGPGVDELQGSLDDDTVRVADGGTVDTVDCLAGKDGGEADDADQLTNCELDIPAASVADAGVREGEGTGTVTVTLSEAPEVDTTIAVKAVEGTAKPGTDYAFAPRTLTFTPTGPLEQDVTFEIGDDGIHELSEAFTVQLETTGADVTGPATVTIDDDDPAVAPRFTQQPADALAREDFDAASFTVAVEGNPAPTLQWQRKLRGEDGFTDLAGETGTTLELRNPKRDQDGALFRAVARSLAAPDGVPSEAAELTVHHKPYFPDQPQDATADEGQQAVFDVKAVGLAQELQWEAKAPGADAFAPVPGQNSTKLVLRDVMRGQDGTIVRVRARDGDGEETLSDEAKLTVRYAPGFTTQPADQTVRAGEDATFSAAAKGNPEGSLQWQRKAGDAWQDLAGETGGTLVLEDVTAGDDGALVRALARNELAPDGVPSDEARLTVTTGPGFGTQPADQTVTEGGDARFEVVVTGPSPAAVQWQRKVAGSFRDLPGETGTALVLRRVTAADDGAVVRAIATADGVSATSDEATLDVQVPPSFTTQPEADQLVDPGSEVTLAVAVAGDPEPALRWQRARAGGGWEDLPGEAGTTLRLTDVRTGQVLRALASNAARADVASDSATIRVREAPAITAEPADAEVRPGGDATFEGAASGTPQPALQWEARAPGAAAFAPLAGRTTGTLVLEDVTDAQHGTLVRLRATDDRGTAAVSREAALSVRLAPAFTTQPKPVTVAPGGDATFTVATSGRPAPAVRWQRKGPGGFADIPGAGGPELVLEDVTAADDGAVVRAIASTSQDSIPSEEATLTVQAAPSFTTQPNPQEVVEGEDATWTVAVQGEPAPVVRWQRRVDGAFADIDGATGPSYTMKAVTRRDAGTVVRAVATNRAGERASDTASLDVRWAPEFTTQPEPQTVDAGEEATFTVDVTSNPGPTVRWQVRAPGSEAWQDAGTGTRLVLPARKAEDDGARVRALASNAVRSDVASETALLTVRHGPTVTAPEDRTVDAGEDAAFSVTATGQPAPRLQWQARAPGADAFTDLAGETGRTLVVRATTAEQDGTQVRVVAAGGAGPDARSAPATLTVRHAPVVGGRPEDRDVDEGEDAVFSVTVRGTPAPEVRWQRAAPGEDAFADVPGATERSLTLGAVERAQHGTRIRAVVANTEGEVVTEAASLSVGYAPRVVAGPQDRTVDEGADATFAVELDGRPAPAVQWQRKLPGAGAFEDVEGATAPAFVVRGAERGLDGLQVRAVARNRAGSVPSEPATLEVTPRPAPTQGQGQAAGAQAGGGASAAAPCVLLAVLDARRDARGRVVVTGFAPPTAAGRRVTLLGDGKPAGTLVVQRSGLFQGVVRRAGKYVARLGELSSRGLRVERRLVLTTTTAARTHVRVAGRLTIEGRRPAALTVTRQPLCGAAEAAGTVRLGKGGRFSARLPRPSKATGVVVYRLRADLRGARSFSVPVVVGP